MTLPSVVGLLIEHQPFFVVTSISESQMAQPEQVANHDGVNFISLSKLFPFQGVHANNFTRLATDPLENSRPLEHGLGSHVTWQRGKSDEEARRSIEDGRTQGVSMTQRSNTRNSASQLTETCLIGLAALKFLDMKRDRFGQRMLHPKYMRMQASINTQWEPLTNSLPG